jgi:hypothetical protein
MSFSITLDSTLRIIGVGTEFLNPFCGTIFAGKRILLPMHNEIVRKRVIYGEFTSKGGLFCLISSEYNNFIS